MKNMDLSTHIKSMGKFCFGMKYFFLTSGFFAANPIILHSKSEFKPRSVRLKSSVELKVSSKILLVQAR